MTKHQFGLGIQIGNLFLKVWFAFWFNILPGVPDPQLLVPKLVTPTWNQGLLGLALWINGPPESPLQLSLPIRRSNFEKKIIIRL